MGKRAVFLDRDGTINEEIGYLGDPAKLVILPGAAGAIRRLNEAGFEVFIVTNQAGVARGYFTEDVVRKIHRRLIETLAEGGAHVRAIYYCPHHPDFLAEGETPCSCRKPEPGMLLAAANDFDIDLSASFVVGDTLKDFEAGERGGARSILLLTGYGASELEKTDICHALTAPDLESAARHIVGSESVPSETLVENEH
ncbi:MAG: D-glycero-alpha-D-manno-heptose-1,7-bisphosphate 7-phosphatase [Candidatus Aquicultorales bacterium]